MYVFAATVSQYMIFPCKFLQKIIKRRVYSQDIIEKLRNPELAKENNYFRNFELFLEPVKSI
jgi:hypothetical protein